MKNKIEANLERLMKEFIRNKIAEIKTAFDAGYYSIASDLAKNLDQHLNVIATITKGKK